MNAYYFFRFMHSGFRYVVMALLVAAIVQSLAGWFGQKPYTPGHRKTNMFTMISAHIQLLLGIVLYFLSPLVRFAGDTMKDSLTRYWTVEHQAMMLFAIILITVGHIRSKKIAQAEGKHRTVAIFYILALGVIIVAIIQGHRPVLGMTY